MEKPDLLYSSGEEKEVQELRGLLEGTPQANVSVVREAHLLKGRVELPFIETASGRHIVGVKAIRRYLKQQAAPDSEGGTQ